MLKYLYSKQIFSEIPEEITLGISISGCQIRCYGCHSRDLWEDKGTPLTVKELHKLIEKNKGITCVCFFGGEHAIDELKTLLSSVPRCLKTAWYCGLDLINKKDKDIYKYLDYIKLGHFDLELGGLDSPTTNQRLYKLNHLEDGTVWETDITNLLQKQNQ